MKNKILLLSLVLLSLAFSVVSVIGVDVTSTLKEGGKVTITARGQDYEVTLLSSKDTSAQFSVNGEVTQVIRVGDSYTLADGSVISVISITTAAVNERYSVKFGLNGKAKPLPKLIMAVHDNAPATDTILV